MASKMNRARLEKHRWFARPEGGPQLLRLAPQLECWNNKNDRAQQRLQKYLTDTQSLLGSPPSSGPWALRLDVGLPPERNLIDMADLDNYLYPLAKRLAGDYRLGNAGLVSAWCTKQHSEQSFVRIEPARATSSPASALLQATTTPPAKTYKMQVRNCVIEATELPPGAVRLELSFVVGPGRNWLNLWKPTIDALDPLLGRTYPKRDWHPHDGRITELGMHVHVDPSVGYDVTIAIAASSCEHLEMPLSSNSERRNGKHQPH